MPIRLATAQDAAALAVVYGPYVRDSVISFEVEPPDPAEMERRRATVAARWPWLVAEERGVVLGYAYAGEHRSRAAYRWDVDAAVYLSAAAHRRGLGRRLYTVLFELLRAQHYVNVYAGITLPNPASVALHESMGFVLAGHYPDTGYKFGAWHDVGWWRLALQPPPPAPAEPVPFPRLEAAWVSQVLERA